jgi:hypothetical protein
MGRVQKQEMKVGGTMRRITWALTISLALAAMIGCAPPSKDARLASLPDIERLRFADGEVEVRQ